MDSFSYLLGVVLTDGCLYKQAARDTRVRKNPRRTGPAIITKYWLQLKCKDLTFAQRFADAIGDLRGRPCSVYPIRRTNFGRSTLRGGRKDYVWDGYTVMATFKDLFLRLEAARDAILAGTYDWPPEVIPRDILLGIIDGDGSVHKSGRITISNSRPHVTVEVCRRAGIECRTYDYTHQTVPHVTIKKSLADTFDTIKRRT